MRGTEGEWTGFLLAHLLVPSVYTPLSPHSFAARRAESGENEGYGKEGRA